MNVDHRGFLWSHAYRVIQKPTPILHRHIPHRLHGKQWSILCTRVNEKNIAYPPWNGDSIEESESLHRFTLGACMQHTYWRSLGRRCEKSELLVEMALLALAIESPCIETLLDLLVNLDILVHCFTVVLLSRFFPSELHHFRYVYVCAELHFYEVYKI